MDFPILLVEVGVPVGHMLVNSGFLCGWLHLNGEVSMWTVGSDIEGGE